MEEKAFLDQVSDSGKPIYGLSKGLRMLLEKKDSLLKLCQKYELKKLYVFGSILEKKFDDKSDVDFLIEFKDIPFDRYTDYYFFLHEELESLFEREIDLLTDKSITNTYLKEKINNSRLLLYAA